MLEKLMNNPLAWAILAVIAVISLVYAIICQYKNKEKKEFSYRKKSNTLIHKKKSKYEKLSITYDGHHIEDLCVSAITIWNSGNRTLNSYDIVQSKELKIKAINNNKILDIYVVKVSEPTNNFTVNKTDEKTATVSFDYADKKDGIVIQVIHTGNEDDLRIDCKIKGGKPIKNYSKKTLPYYYVRAIKKDAFSKPFLILVMIVLFFVLITAIVFTISIFNTDLQSALITSGEMVNTPTTSRSIAISFSIGSWLYSFIVLFLWIPLAKTAFDLGIPRKLKTDFDSIEPKKEERTLISTKRNN